MLSLIFTFKGNTALELSLPKWLHVYFAAYGGSSKAEKCWVVSVHAGSELEQGVTTLCLGNVFLGNSCFCWAAWFFESTRSFQKDQYTDISVYIDR